MSGNRTTNGRAARIGERSAVGLYATRLTFAAISLFDALSMEQRARALLPFDDPNRRHWDFLPESGRRGLRLREMTSDQQMLVHRLIAEALQPEAYAKVLNTMSLEHILREIQAPVFGHVAPYFRDPLGYYFSFFGQPNPDVDWGWRLVGHHLSLNVTVVGQDFVAVTPMLIGSEPGRFGVMRGLADEEDLGFALLRSLTPAQRERAMIHPVAPPDLVTRTVETIGEVEIPDYHGRGRRDHLITDEDRHALRYLRSQPRGVAMGELKSEPRRRFMELLECFVSRVRPELATYERDRIAAAGLDGLHFAWAGHDDYEGAHYYRIQGPVTLIEFVNSEDDANHIHCVWRDPTNDFADALLARRPASG